MAAAISAAPCPVFWTSVSPHSEMMSLRRPMSAPSFPKPFTSVPDRPAPRTAPPDDSVDSLSPSPTLLPQSPPPGSSGVAPPDAPPAPRIAPARINPHPAAVFTVIHVRIHRPGSFPKLGSDVDDGEDG